MGWEHQADTHHHWEYIPQWQAQLVHHQVHQHIHHLITMCLEEQQGWLHLSDRNWHQDTHTQPQNHEDQPTQAHLICQQLIVVPMRDIWLVVVYNKGRQQCDSTGLLFTQRFLYYGIQYQC